MTTLSLDRLRPRLLLGWTVCVTCGLMVGLLILGFGAQALGILALGVLLAIWRDPRLGLVLTILITYNLANPGILGPRSGDVFREVTQYLGLITTLAVTWHVLTRRLGVVVTGHTLVLMMFCLLAYVSTFYAGNREIAREDLSHLIPVFALYLLIVHLVKTPTQVEYGLWILMSVGLVAAGVAVLQYLWPAYHIDSSTYWLKHGEHSGAAVVERLESIDMAVTRVAGTLWHHNWLALFVISILPINLYAWHRTSTRRGRWTVLGITALELTAAALTFTRMVVVGVAFVLWMAHRKGLLKLRSAAPILVPAAVIALLLLPSGFRARVFSLAQVKKSDSISSRSLMQQGGLQILQDHWLLGVGIGNFGVVFNQQDHWLAERMATLRKMGADYNPDTLGAHNMYLEAAVETGLLGLGLLVLSLMLCLKGCREVERHYRSVGHTRFAELAAVLQICLGAFCFLALFLHALDQKVLWILMGLTTALGVAAWPQRNLLVCGANGPVANPLNPKGVSP